MTSILDRDSFDNRQIEYLRISLLILALIVAAATWNGVKDRLIYPAACSSVGCPGREELIAAALRRDDPHFPNLPQLWYYDHARPEWIAWSSERSTPLPGGPWIPKWSVITVTDRQLVVRGYIEGGRLTVPPADADHDGSCEVIRECRSEPNAPQKDLRLYVVVRLGEKENEIVWAGTLDPRVWTSRQTRLKPIWRDVDGDGMDELVFITVKIVRTPEGGVVCKPPETIAVFEWTAPGGTLRTRLLPDDCGIVPWELDDGDIPVRVDQSTELDPLVRELLGV